MKKIMVLFILSCSSLAFANCIMICTPRWDPDLLLVVVECEVRCEVPPDQNPDDNPEPIPDPVTCGSQGFFHNFRVEMAPVGCATGCGTVFNPTVGKWTNSFRFRGNVSGTLGLDARTTIAYNNRPFEVNHTTIMGHSFDRTVYTASSDRNHDFHWEAVAEVLCGDDWEAMARESGEVDLKTSGSDYNRTLTDSDVFESREHIIQINTCTGGFHTMTQTHTRMHSFELGASIEEFIQLKYGWSDTVTLSQGTRVALPTYEKVDVVLDTVADHYNIHGFEYDWLGSPSTPMYVGRVRIRKLRISLPKWADCD